MNMSMVVSNYRKARKHNDEYALGKLMQWYIEVQYFILPSEYYNCHGLTGHGSVFYTAEEFENDVLNGKLPPNKEFIEALYYIADKILENEICGRITYVHR